MIISRGELVQIGGGFRIGEILEASGARLREVGATNKTALRDYAQAIGPETGLILKVHQSNFFIGGFAGAPSTEEIATAGADANAFLLSRISGVARSSRRKNSASQNTNRRLTKR